MKYLKGIWYTFVTLLAFVCGSTEIYASGRSSMDMATNGTVVAAWMTYNNLNESIIQTNINVGNTWGKTPQTISSPSSHDMDFPKVSAAFNGSSDIYAVAIWAQSNENNIMALYASMLPSSTSDWSTAIQISEDPESIVGSSQYFVRINEAGNIIATWSSIDALNVEHIRSATAQIGSINNWSSPLNISGS